MADTPGTRAIPMQPECHQPETAAATCEPVWAWIGLSRPVDPEKLIASEMLQGAPPHARFRATTAKLLAGGAKGGLQKVSFKPK